MRLYTRLRNLYVNFNFFSELYISILVGSNMEPTKISTQPFFSSLHKTKHRARELLVQFVAACVLRYRCGA